MKYRIGLDVGTNSLGWSVLKLNGKDEVTGIEAAGSRIFSDGRDNKSKATLAADRREARSARRRRDRYIQRRSYLLNALTEAGLFPKDTAVRQALQKLNPLELRSRLLTESAADILADIKKRSDKTGEATNHPDMQSEYLVGRALFHLNQRRGFKSNRNDSNEEGGKDGVVAQSERALMEAMGLIEPKEEYQEKKKQADKIEYENRELAYKKLRDKENFSYGAFLWLRQNKEKPETTRVRKTGSGKNDLYEFYPTRRMYLDEFKKIWDAQARHYSLQMADKDHFHKIIFTQRPLKPQKRGKCTYMPKHERTFRAMPSFQRYRIYSEVNNLKWNNDKGFAKAVEPQVHDARNAIIKLLEKPTNQKGNLVWSKIENKIKEFELAEGNIQFNIARDTKRENGLDGNLTSNVMQHENYVGSDWHTWDLGKQDEFIDIILNGTPAQQERDKKEEEDRKAGRSKKTITDGAQDTKEIIEYLMGNNFNLSEHAATNCANARLLDATANISLEAARRMLKKMRDGIEKPDKETGEINTVLPIQPDAAKSCSEEDPENFKNPFRSKGDDGKYELQDCLPYYGELFKDGRHIIPGTGEEKDKEDARKFYGGVTNLTVHIALNQIRRVVNKIIKQHGKPQSIAIELSRELPEGADKRNEIEGEQKTNQDKNEQYDKILDEFNQKKTSDNRLRVELWEKQGRFCPYTLEPIGCGELFSNAVQIDHILPYSRSQDDSRANKVVCKTRANQVKRDKTPWEAFHGEPDWDKIQENAIVRYWHKKDKQWKDTNPRIALWRFKENAFKIWEGDTEEVEKAARKMAEHTDERVKSIGKQILEKGVGSLSDKQKEIAEKYGVPHPEFSPRHLNDTRYIGRLTREYLEAVCHIDEIHVLTGRHTALLRNHWKLNSILKELADETEHPKDHNQPKDKQAEKSTKKNRDDHRHHAIDAIVIGMTNRSILKRVTDEAQRQEKKKQEIREAIEKSGRAATEQQEEALRYVLPKDTIDPWDGFRKDVKKIVKHITVSHKAKKKKLHPGKTTDGQLHNETALGLIKPINEAKNEWKTVVRRPIDYFKERKHVEAIRDDKWRLAFVQAFDDAEAVGKKGAEGVLDLANDEGIRRLRCYGPKQAIPIRDKNGKAYKGYQGDSNWGMEIYAFPEGHKKADKWEGVVISRYDANKPGFQPGTTYRPHPEARLVMRLQINDCIEIEEDGKKPRILYFVKCNQAGTMFFADHNEANLRKRNDDKLDNFKYFQKTANSLKPFNPRKVHISPTGQVNYEKRGKKRSKSKKG